MLQHLPTIEVLSIFMVTMLSVDVATHKNEHQQSVNDYWCCVWYHPLAVLRHLSTIEVLDTVIGNIVSVDVTAT